MISFPVLLVLWLFHVISSSSTLRPMFFSFFPIIHRFMVVHVVLGRK